MYHFEPVVIAEEVKQREPLALEVGLVEDIIAPDDCRSEISVSRFLNDVKGRIENSDDSEDGLL